MSKWRIGQTPLFGSAGVAEDAPGAGGMSSRPVDAAELEHRVGGAAPGDSGDNRCAESYGEASKAVETSCRLLLRGNPTGILEHGPCWLRWRCRWPPRWISRPSSRWSAWWDVATGFTPTGDLWRAHAAWPADQARAVGKAVRNNSPGFARTDQRGINGDETEDLGSSTYIQHWSPSVGSPPGSNGTIMWSRTPCKRYSNGIKYMPCPLSNSSQPGRTPP